MQGDAVTIDIALVQALLAAQFQNGRTFRSGRWRAAAGTTGPFVSAST
jgi:hypothetical protein